MWFVLGPVPGEGGTEGHRAAMRGAHVWHLGTSLPSWNSVVFSTRDLTFFLYRLSK